MRRGVVAVLLGVATAFGQDVSDRVRLERLEEIARSGRKGLASVRLVVLYLERDAVRDRAWDVLLAMGPEVLPHLMSVLSESGPGVRRDVGAVMLELAEGVEKLPLDKWIKDNLTDEDAVLRRVAGVLALKSGDVGVRRLLSLSASTRPEVRETAAYALGRAGAGVLPRLRSRADHKSARTRQGAILALGHMGTLAREAAPAVLARIDDERDIVRTAAAWALGRLGGDPGKVVPALVAHLRDDDPEVRAASRDSLSRLGPPAVSALVEALQKARPEDRDALAVALMATGQHALPSLVDLAASADPGIRSVALLCLGNLGSYGLEEALAPVASRLDDPDARVRTLAVRALGRFPAHLALPHTAGVLAAASAPDPALRRAALLALGDLTPPAERALQAVNSALDDADPGVAGAARYAHWRYGGPVEPAVGALRAILADGDETEDMRIHAADMLRRCGAPAEAAIGDLCDVLVDRARGRTLRMTCAAALGELFAFRTCRCADRASVIAAAARPRVRAAVDRALGWLAKHQRADGSWASAQDKDRGYPEFDYGVSALAVLAFLSAGQTDRDGPHAAVVARGLDYLARGQAEDGRLGPDGLTHLVQQAFATQALCEAQLMTGDTRRQPVIFKSLEYLERARNPKWVWRYKTAEGGENDTQHAVTMLMTLRLGQACGYRVDPEALRGIDTWIDRMTDPNFGQVGYNFTGGVPFRAQGFHDGFPPERSHAMTAAGMWCRILLDHPTDSEMVKKGANLCVEIPPRWDIEGGYLDLYYWYWGTLALKSVGRAHWRKWEPALEAALVRGQCPPGSPQAGSWPPDGPWGLIAGRVYATAFATMSLTGQWRYEDGFWLPGAWLRSPYDRALASLLRARNDDDDFIAIEARLALRGTGWQND